MSQKFLRAGHGTQRLDWLAGHVRFELRNVVANYPFENSRRFAGNQSNSGQGDHSRLSCNAGDTQLGPAASIPRPRAHVGPKMIRWRQTSNTIGQFALDFPRKESVCGEHGRRACPSRTLNAVSSTTSNLTCIRENVRAVRMPLNGWPTGGGLIP